MGIQLTLRGNDESELKNRCKRHACSGLRLCRTSPAGIQKNRYFFWVSGQTEPSVTGFQ